MQTAKQLTVSLVNKPGRLVDMLATMNKGKVNFRALAVMDSGERGSVRFVPDDFDAAKSVLDSMSMRYDAADVLLVEVPSQMGGFSKICEKLAMEHLNIDYAYCSFNGGSRPGGALAIIKVNDLAKAQRVLSEGISVKKKLTQFRRLVLSR